MLPRGVLHYLKLTFLKKKPTYTNRSAVWRGAAMAHGLIYTFGPTFRAEKSKTRRHLSEFWMIEPEMAFYDLEMNMDLAEDMLKSIVADILKNYSQELSLLERDTSSLQRLVEKDFVRINMMIQWIF